MTVVGTLAEPVIKVRGTQATLTAYASTPTTSFDFNFTDKLLFDTAVVSIKTISTSVVLDMPQAPVAYATRRAEGAVVHVDVAEAITGSVTVVVDQSLRRGE